ncbi:zinc ribbon domain-containing protein [Fusibacter ferrireducens]|uniref:Zinc ribbon domain-containing protein n=1 Tax=Fusibacter ferrireducens TaxID=2785058 RepID=A0ABR9ZTM6_9FIRM|nr:zinc ribbon domain-containing protein [Fusibacter ferrireducens]MBF4693498.1 zinc ribbon domain-containing protein [Fusibacter ferrireducens]
MKICQSCGMPMMNAEDFGNNKDGSKSETYCKYCFPKGVFNNPNETFEEMVESCMPFEVQRGVSEEVAREKLTQTLSTLKRWR